MTIPVRRESWTWDDTLPPVLQMNLPEGYLLQILREQFGPHIGASPMASLSVMGRNMVGRLQVAAPGAKLDEPAESVEVSALLQGDNSEEALAVHQDDAGYPAVLHLDTVYARTDTEWHGFLLQCSAQGAGDRAHAAARQVKTLLEQGQKTDDLSGG